MSNHSIYWKEYDKPVKIFDPILKVEREQLGRFICSDERVLYFDFMGFWSPSKQTLGCKAIFVFQDGKQYETEITTYLQAEMLLNSEDPAKMQQDFYILQAEQYLNTI